MTEKCTLKDEARRCENRKCDKCGWSRNEAVRRRAALQENGLTLCDDGLRRLIFPKKEGGEEPQKEG